MANVLARRKALKLRKLGKSYSQIKQEIAVSKSTLSLWLKNYPLSPEQIYRLNHTEASREKYRNTMRLKKETHLQKYYSQAQTTLLPFSNKELFIAGLFLYWGEGGKTQNGTLSISNTDPAVLQFSLLWMNKSLCIPKEKVNVLLHLYEDMCIEKTIDYWSNILKLPENQFGKPYIKKSKKTDIDYKGYGHGTCMLRVCNTQITETILMSIKAVADYSNLRIPEL